MWGQGEGGISRKAQFRRVGPSDTVLDGSVAHVPGSPAQGTGHRRELSGAGPEGSPARQAHYTAMVLMPPSLGKQPKTQATFRAPESKKMKLRTH